MEIINGAAGEWRASVRLICLTVTQSEEITQDKDGQGRTLLHIAALNGVPEAVQGCPRVLHLSATITVGTLQRFLLAQTSGPKNLGPIHLMHCSGLHCTWLALRYHETHQNISHWNIELPGCLPGRIVQTLQQRSLEVCCGCVLRFFLLNWVYTGRADLNAKHMLGRGSHLQVHLCCHKLLLCQGPLHVAAENDAVSCAHQLVNAKADIILEVCISCAGSCYCMPRFPQAQHDDESGHIFRTQLLQLHYTLPHSTIKLERYVS